jgi:hypothetical protein
MRPPADSIAPNTALDEAVLTNSLLDIEAILASRKSTDSIFDNKRPKASGRSDGN